MRSEGVHVALLLGLRGGEKSCQHQGFQPPRSYQGGGGAKRATIFFSYILTCDFSVPECINSRGLFNY